VTLSSVGVSSEAAGSSGSKRAPDRRDAARLSTSFSSQRGGFEVQIVTDDE
jgi:hypothetical protein